MSTTRPDCPTLLSLTAAVDSLRSAGVSICRDTLIAWCRAGRVRFIRIGARYFVHRDSLNALLSAA